jgi:hypothetical protein
MADRDALDLFGFLSQLSRRDLSSYDKLSDEAKKVVAPFVLMRWMSGTSDAAQIVRLNAVVNKYAFSLGQEKALLCKLLAAAATGSTNRYSWLKGPGSKATRLRLEAVKSYYGVSAREAQAYSTVGDDDILKMAEELGWSDDEMKKLKKELA